MRRSRNEKGLNATRILSCTVEVFYIIVVVWDLATKKAKPLFNEDRREYVDVKSACF